jgi:hypothetical protein
MFREGLRGRAEQQRPRPLPPQRCQRYRTVGAVARPVRTCKAAEFVGAQRADVA